MASETMGVQPVDLDWQWRTRNGDVEGSSGDS